MIDPFEKVWTSAFGATLPLGHCLRHEHFDRWTRFHSLPSSKRYSGTLDERQIILHRANTLGYECFTAGEQIWLVSCPLFATLLETCDGSNDDLTLGLQRRYTVEVHSGDESEKYLICADLVSWRSGLFDDLLSRIADDQCRALFFSKASGRVLAPYDGGFDVVGGEPTWIGGLERQYRDWMSARADRL